MHNNKILTFEQWKRRRNIRRIAINIFIAIALFCGIMFMTILYLKSNPHGYYIGIDSEEYFTYVTERRCKIVHTNGFETFVTYDGEIYSFFDSGYEAGEIITCQFTDDMQIIGVID